MVATPAEEQSADFFISYTATDRSWAEWVAWQLQKAGYTVILQAWDFVPGRDFVHEMVKATSSANRIIAILSNDYTNSPFGEAEWGVAFAKDPRGEKGLLIPVKVAPCTPPSLLATRVYIDLTEKAADEAREILLSGVRGKGARPIREPAFPGELAEPPMYPGDTGPRHKPLQANDTGRISFPEGRTAIYFYRNEGPIKGAAVASDQYRTLQELLDELYVAYLRKLFPPFSYGKNWILTDYNRCIVPIAWLSAVWSPVREIAEEWLASRPSDVGVRINRGFHVGVPRDPGLHDFFGVVTNDAHVLDVLDERPKGIWGLPGYLVRLEDGIEDNIIDDSPVRSLSPASARGIGRYEAVFGAWEPDDGSAGKVFDLREGDTAQSLSHYDLDDMAWDNDWTYPNRPD